jgi:hypothetical protein
MNKHITAIIMLAITFTFTACEEKKSKSGETATPATITVESGGGGNASQLAHAVTFKNKEIPITLFRSNKVDGSGESTLVLDSLVFQYDGTKHTLRTILHDYARDYEVSVSDYNFNGYMDIAIESERCCEGMVGKDIYLYNPKNKSYYYHKELSETTNTTIDDETKTVTLFYLDNFERAESHSSKYKWENGQLVEIYSESLAYDEGLGKDIRITKTLQNGKWVQSTDTISGE